MKNWTKLKRIKLGNRFQDQKNKNVIGTKWVFKNKVNENGQVIRNKARLVCKGYAQVEGVYIEETFAPMEKLESIRIFLAFASYKKIESIPYGCQVSISQWKLRRGSLS